MKARQLRIHGVSGTPPDEMLATDPIGVESRLGGEVAIFEPVPLDTEVRAYRWSSLTSGNPMSAFWVGLLPFMLANLAGWSLPPLSPRLEKVAAGLVRLAGLALTVIFALVTAHGFMDIAGFQYLHLQKEFLSVGGAVALGGAVAGLVLTSLWGLVSATSEPTEVDEDPVGRYSLCDPGFWQAHTVESRFRLLHLAGALLAVAWMASEMMASAAVPADPIRVLVTSAGLPFLVGGISIGLAFGARIGRLAEIAVVGSALGLVWTTIEYADADDEMIGAIQSLTASGHPMSISVLALTFLTIGVLFVGFGSRQRHNLVTAPALLAIAGIGGTGVGAAIISVLARATRTQTPEWIDRVSEAFLTGLATAAAVLAVTIVVRRDRSGGPKSVRLMRTIRRTRDSVEPLLWILVIGSIGLVLGLVGDRLGWWEFRIPATIPFVLGFVGLGLIAVWLVFRGWFLIGLSLTAVMALGWVWKIKDVDLWVVDYSDVAVSLTILIPTGLLLSRVVGAFRNAERRRELAVAWDVGSFFPRWYHPFAPPPYGPRAVPDLADYVATQPQPVVVAGHSQGSVLAIASLVRGGHAPDNAALLTFGSPLGPLYGRYFCNSFGDLGRLEEVLKGRWINLFRENDPVAGPVRLDADRPALEDASERGHGGYWFEPEFGEAVEELKAGLVKKPAGTKRRPRALPSE